MVLLDPRDDVVTESDRQRPHRIRVGVGNEADTFVAGDGPLLSEGVGRVDGRK